MIYSEIVNTNLPRENSMSKNKELQVVPFFARFLEAQAPAPSDKAPLSTLKYPSDFEDY